MRNAIFVFVLYPVLSRTRTD